MILGDLMNLYLDLSVLVSLLLGCTSFISLKVLVNQEFSKGLSILFVLFHALFFFFIYIDQVLSYLCYFTFTIAFGILLFKRKVFIHLMIYYFFYFGISLFLASLNEGIHFYHAFMMIYSPKGILLSLWIPIWGIFMCLSSLFVDKYFHLRNYIQEVELTINQKSYVFNAYFDTGNTLRYKNTPVIFIGNMKNEMDSSLFKEKIPFNTLTGSSFILGTKGLLTIKGKKDSYFVYVAFNQKQEEFHGCKCLLNAYIF